MLTEEEAREIFALVSRVSRRAVPFLHSVCAIFSTDTLCIGWYQRPGRALDAQGQYTFQADSSESPTIVGQRYKIASRTVRDIWNRKSWIRATRPDWTPEEIAASEENPEVDNADIIPAQTRKRGRPSGAKDAFPRMRRRQDSPTDSASPEPGGGAAGPSAVSGDRPDGGMPAHHDAPQLSAHAAQAPFTITTSAAALSAHERGGGAGTSGWEGQMSQSVKVTDWLGTLWKSLSSQKAALSSGSSAPLSAASAGLQQPPPQNALLRSQSVPALCEYCARRRSDELCPHYTDAKPASHTLLAPASQQDGGAFTSASSSLSMTQDALRDASSSSLPQ